MPKKFKKSDILINLVIDQSGSMAYSADAIVSGINELLAEQVAQKGTTYVTLTLFNSSFDVRFVATDARNMPSLGSFLNPYSPSGMTALYDAVGASIVGVDGWLRNNPGFKGSVLNVIWTDGLENASRLYGSGAVNRMITERQERGQVFQFLGSGHSGWAAARVFTAIPTENVARFHGDGASYLTAANALSTNTTNLRTTGLYAGVKGNA